MWFVSRVSNNLTGEMSAGGWRRCIVAAYVILLSKHGRRITWVIDRDFVLSFRNRELDVDLGLRRERVSARIRVWVARFSCPGG